MKKSGLKSLASLLCLSVLAASCTLFGGKAEEEDNFLPVVTATPGDAGGTTATGGGGGGQATAAPPATATPTATPTQHPLFPTPVVLDTFIAEQEFEHGWAFAIVERSEIWVLIFTDERSGTWTIYDDEFNLEQERTGQELLVQIDETPPEDKVAPVRGFGYLWANNEEVRNGLGWGVWIELGRVTILRYDAGGTINADGDYVQRPGRYTLTDIGGDVFVMDESTQTFTWSPTSPE